MKKRTVFLSYFLIIAMVLASIIGSSRAVTAMIEYAPTERNPVIVIDAGHGGVDGGATSCTGILESSFNLEIALRLEALLQFLGLETKMIRTSDISVYKEGTTIAQKKISDLKNRVQTVNKLPDAILLSIHQNNFTDSRYSGAQVFFGREEGSRALAEQLQSAFRSTVNPGSSRQCKQSSGIYLMEHIQCPGILIECGFLSNPEEEAKLRSPQYQKNLCCVIAATVSTFLSNT